MPKKRQTFLALSFILASALPALAAQEQVMPQTQIQRGMKGTCRTVFSGTEIEPFGFEVLGVMQGMLGPGQDIILARLTGEKAEYTGVVSGMSGSPCSINGQLIGALSYSFGIFTKEPIAGITPIQSMLDILTLPPQEKAPPQTTHNSTFQQALQGGHQPFFQLAPAPALGSLPADPAQLRPIATPLAFSGILPEVLQRYAPELAQLGFSPVLSGMAATSAGQAPKMPAKLEPGGAIGGQLVRGDIDISGTGTVSYVSGNKVLAFGHPFFNQGYIEMPMTTAYIVNTLASSMHSNKISQPGPEVGAIVQDRSSAIYGEIGRKASMIPVEVDIVDTVPSQSAQVRFEVFRNPLLTPSMMLMAIHSSLRQRLYYNLGGTIEMEGQMVVDDRTIRLKNYYSGTADDPVTVFAAADLAETLFKLWNNPFRTPTIKSVKLKYRLRSQTQLAMIEKIVADREEVRPGDKVTLSVSLRTYRGEEVVRQLLIQIPADTPNGNVDILAGNGNFLDMVEQSVKTGYQNYEEMVSDLEKRRANNKLYFLLVTGEAGMARYSQLLPKLPPSMMTLLNSPDARNRSVELRRSPSKEYVFDLDYDLQGQGFVSLYVSPSGQYLNQNMHGLSLE